MKIVAAVRQLVSTPGACMWSVVMIDLRVWQKGWSGLSFWLQASSSSEATTCNTQIY